MAHNESTGVGCRLVHVGIRDDDGTMKIQGSPAAGTAYAGIQADRARALTVTPAEPQRIPARGDDITYHTFQVSPADSPTGELRTQQSDTALIALITSVTDFGSGNVSMVPLSSDKLGTEDPVFVWGTRMAVLSGTGSANTRVWETYIILNAIASARPPGFEVDAIGEFVWSLAGNNSSTDQFGRTMTEGVHGCTEAAMLLIKTRYKFFIDFFEGDGAETDFTVSKGTDIIDDSHADAATSPVFCFVEGVSVAKTVSAAGVVVPAGGVASGEKVVIQYEYDN